MLHTLSIRDVVLIDRLDLTFHPTLCVLTGETGAGKSILLDALGLALGARGDTALIRQGAQRATVSATFEVADDHPAWVLLAEHGLDGAGDLLILRRVLDTDGRGRAFVNDQPVGVSLLRDVGETLAQIHGQSESRRLSSPAVHRQLLDAHGDLGAHLGRVREGHEAWRRAHEASLAAAERLAAARRDETMLRHGVEELTAADPQPGEEAQLAEKRAILMHREKLLEALNQAAAELADGRGVEAALRSAGRHLERVAPLAERRLDGAIAAFDRAIIEMAEAQAQLERAGQSIELDPRDLDRLEERLFALRSLARKHAVAVDDLPGLRRSLETRLATLDDGAAALDKLRSAEASARTAYEAAAGALNRARRGAGKRLDAAMVGELGPLMMGGARFETAVETLGEENWGPAGWDRVRFKVATNPGQKAGPLNRISSGGEMARFTLALKVVLADADPVPTIVFDEVDSGVGGAVADAVGERLARLAENFQVLVVTHSPQVAARGRHHWRVSKSNQAAASRTMVDPLSPDAREEEIARMLAGARVTDEARAAAASLLGGPVS